MCVEVEGSQMNVSLIGADLIFQHLFACDSFILRMYGNAASWVCKAECVMNYFVENFGFF